MSNEESDFTNNVLMSAKELVINFPPQISFDTNIHLRGLAVRQVLSDINFTIKAAVVAAHSMKTKESIDEAIHDFYVAWTKSKETSHTM